MPSASPSRCRDVARIVALAALGPLSPAFAGETIRVAVERLNFETARVSARVGDATEWVNHDFVAQTATARADAWDVLIPADGRARATLRAAGDFDYFAAFNPI